MSKMSAKSDKFVFIIASYLGVHFLSGYSVYLSRFSGQLRVFENIACCELLCPYLKDYVRYNIYPVSSSYRIAILKSNEVQLCG